MLRIRVLVDGCWGFSSTSNFSTDALKNILYDAISIAKLLFGKGLAEVKQMAKGHLNSKVKGNLENVDIEQKLKITSDAERSGFYVKNGNILCPIKELMMVSNTWRIKKSYRCFQRKVYSIHHHALHSIQQYIFHC